jgi:hypothetical protein
LGQLTPLTTENRQLSSISAKSAQLIQKAEIDSGSADKRTLALT